MKASLIILLVLAVIYILAVINLRMGYRKVL
jgi:hypothetical protein